MERKPALLTAAVAAVLLGLSLGGPDDVGAQMLGGGLLLLALALATLAWWGDAMSEDLRPWIVPLIASMHLVASIAILFVDRGRCGGGPVPGIFESLFMGYMGATRMLPVLLLLLLGMAGSVVQRFRRPGVATLAVSIVWYLQMRLLDFHPWECHGGD